ncbi:MAG: hypothetical protein WKF30_05175 [Pyrinomonadaceae bacterium]
MTKMRNVFFAVLGVLMTSTFALAQTMAADNQNTENSWKAIAAVFGFAIAAAGGAIGQSRIGAAAVEGTARNPGASARIQILMIIGLALIESLVLFTLVIVFART